MLSENLTDKVLSKMYYDNWDGKLPSVVTNGSPLLNIPVQDDTDAADASKETQPAVKTTPSASQPANETDNKTDNSGKGN